MEQLKKGICQLFKTKIYEKLFLLSFVFLFFNSINAQVDIGVISIVSPEGVVPISGPVSVKVWVKNFGTQSVDSIPIIFSRYNNMFLYDTVVIANGIQAGDSMLIEPDINFNSSLGIYLACITANVANDVNLANNEKCNCVFGSLSGQEMDLSIIDIRPTINLPGAGTNELFDLLIKNTGLIPVSTVDLTLYYTDLDYFPISITLNNTLLPDSSQWVHTNMYFNRTLGQNEAKFAINEPSDRISCNDTITYIYYGQRRSFDLSVDSFYCQPAVGDTLLSKNVNLTVFYTNQGTQAINQIFNFASFETYIPFDTISKNVNLQPLQSDSVNIQASFNPLYINEANIGVWILEQDSNSFNDAHLEPYILLISSIENVNNFEKLKIYPNPTKGILNIVSEINNNKVNVNIFNVQGMNVLSANNLGEINLENLPSGIYILKINLDGLINTYKIVKTE